MSETKRGLEIALDFLANPPQSPALNATLHSTSLTQGFSTLNTFDSHAVRLDETNRAKIGQILGLKGYESLRFDYTSGAFLELFSLFAPGQIALASSLHQQSYYAGKLFASRFSHTNSESSSPLVWLNPSLEEGIITPQSLQILQNPLQSPQGKPQWRVIFLPFYNHELLSLNPIDELLEALSTLPNTLIVLDISLLLQLCVSRLRPLPALPQGVNIAYLCNGENLSLSRPSGFMLVPKALSEPFSESFTHLKSLLLPRPSLFEALLQALQPLVPFSESSTESRSDLCLDSEVDSKNELFLALKELLGEDLALFAPLKHTAPNALPLRLSHIKARMLLQSLQIDNIRAINGLDCLFGNAKPSFVLQSMGYSELQSRECLSISYKSLESTQLLNIAKRIAQHYRHLRALSL